MKKQWKLGEDRWRKEKESLEKRLTEMENKIKELKVEKEIEREKVEGKQGEIEEKVKIMERRIEKKERKERKRNIVIKGIRKGRKGMETEIKEIIEELGVKAEIETIKEIEGRGEEIKIAILKVRNIEQKKEIIIKRGKMKEKGIKIEDDLTWKERKMKWVLEEIARQERNKGKSV